MLRVSDEFIDRRWLDAWLQKMRLVPEWELVLRSAPRA